ncbi:MAG: VanZ family protein [Armatimonadota bacterium]
MQQLRRFAYYVGPLLLWMGVIFSLSTNSASAQATNPVVHKILTNLFPWIVAYLSESQTNLIDFCLRKGAHIIEYTILTLLAFRAFRAGSLNFRSYMAYGPPLLCILYAGSDEYHQSFYSQRGAAIGDVFIDSFGVLLASFIALWAWCRRLELSRSKIAAQQVTVVTPDNNR